MRFFMVFIGETRNLVKEVGDEHLICIIKSKWRKFAPILLNDCTVLFVLCGLLTEINALGRNISWDTVRY